MTNREFVSAFIAQKEKFCRQLSLGADNRKTLDLFEKWLKENLRDRTKSTEHPAKKNNNIISQQLDNIVTGAAKILAKQGIQINCVSLPVPVSKSNSRCLRVQPYNTVYYRIRKTSPRKGKHKGEHLISIELVADGNKNKVFLPLLKYKDDIEQDLNLPLERENKSIEATGKYRLKIVFNDMNGVELFHVQKFSRILADFISVTSRYLKKISI
ncbi:hypothetical protein [Desulfallas thermosapovorans]|uniref:Uncharacterized protein n=1 Tax=Desulfallas thermosapovorans DSM 6562 TaxID=1121431 RepID=A0A5S4ZN18_9FIRM|nr:hypothetical protein [Desulfallas thermosapovorans]TYO92308.1 hypothetical protein LX24_02902 [Desulfallas thermosapovorans DSM 6562]